MNPIAYLAEIREDAPGDFIVTFPSIPEAITQGSTHKEAYANAHDALAAAIETYLELGRDIPAPDVAPGQVALDGPYEVSLAPKLAARAQLRRLMRENAISNVRLANLMGKDEKAVRLMVSGKGASLEMTLQALKAIGVQPALAF